MAVGLLERDEQLAVLADRFAKVASDGHLVLISGEAGAGKTALVEEFRKGHLDGERVLLGRCDDLFAARPLGPFVDIARQHPGALSSALSAGDNAAAFEAFLTDVARPPHPVVVVLEDLQWADEATLDLLRLLARRLDVLPCLVIATYRDDIESDHPLRRAWGSLVGPTVTRIALGPLSDHAVATMVAGTGVDAAALYRRTRGNPFFVAEMLAAEQDELPGTVRDTILARATRLSGGARDALDAAAVIGRRCSPDMIEAVADVDLHALDECIEAGFLVEAGSMLDFRHDLTREAIESSLTPLHRRQLHRRALDALGDGDDGSDDVVRRAHHAIGAGDPGPIVELATRAADRCVLLGAHRQAEVLYRAVLKHADSLGGEERIRVLQEHARMCVHVEDLDGAIASGDAALASLEAGDDVIALASWESELSAIYYNAARATEARIMAEQSVGRLEPLGPSPVLARALGRAAGNALVTGRFDDAIRIARRTIELSESVGEDRTAGYAMNVLGGGLAMTGQGDEGVAWLREAHDRLKRGGYVTEYLVASSNLGSALCVQNEFLAAVDVMSAAKGVAEEHDLVFRRNCLVVSATEACLLLGWWDRLLDDFEDVLSQPTVSEHHRMFALAGRGRVEVRRGDRQAAATLAEALERAVRGDEVQIQFPVRLALSELAWLAGDVEGARREARAATDIVEHIDVTGHRDLLAMALRLDLDWRADVELAPIPMMLAGDHRGVAQWWESHGCEYMAADALADSDDEVDLREAHDRLVALGAMPRANHVARRLRERGARDIRRGPRAATRANPAGLTAREAEVARLLRDGLTNSEIASALIVSPKTVDHHVSSVLSKLGVRDRRAVAKAAAEAGVKFD